MRRTRDEIASTTIVFMLPPNELVLWTMLGTAVALTAWWWPSARRRFEGPHHIQ